MIGLVADRDEGIRLDRWMLGIRAAALPVIAIGEALVDHPEQHTTLYGPLLILAALWVAFTGLESMRAKPLPVDRLAIVDLLLLVALVYTSGGPFSQARFALFLAPPVAALISGPRATAIVSVFVVAAYVAISALHPSSDEVPAAFDFEVVQALFLAVVGVVSMILAVLLYRRLDTIEELAASRNRLVAQALAAEDRERRRLAESLHDDALQNLLAARQELSAQREGEQEIAREGVELATAQIRDAVFELHPYLLEQGGLGPALEAVASRQAARGGFEPRIEVDPAAEGLGDQLLFSVGRELLTNAARHANAREVKMSVERLDDRLVLEIADDGRGADPAALAGAAASGHIGLASMAERIEAVGGRLDVDPGLGRGFTARAEIPLIPDDSEAALR